MLDEEILIDGGLEALLDVRLDRMFTIDSSTTNTPANSTALQRGPHPGGDRSLVPPRLSRECPENTRLTPCVPRTGAEQPAESDPSYIPVEATIIEVYSCGVSGILPAVGSSNEACI